MEDCDGMCERSNKQRSVEDIGHTLMFANPHSIYAENELAVLAVWRFTNGVIYEDLSANLKIFVGLCCFPKFWYYAVLLELC